MRTSQFISAILTVAAVSIVTAAVAQNNELPDYAPLLPQARARAWVVDPQKGYLVREIKPDMFMITDGGYQLLFVTTAKGVVLFDAPPSLTKQIDQAVAEVTKEPIVMLLYSHVHVGHIGGAGLILKRNPRIENLMGFDLTQNMDAYIKVFDQILAYDFDVLVAGHHSKPPHQTT
jgi:glyoxylase-like metal-dependent hydrolase (beta-lactamase superfamily II)